LAYRRFTPSLSGKFDLGFLQIPHWLSITGYSLFGQISKVSSGTLAFIYTFPPFRGCNWTFTSKFMTMPVTLRRAVFVVPILRAWLPLPLDTEKSSTMTLKLKKNCLDTGVHYNGYTQELPFLLNINNVLNGFV